MPLPGGAVSGGLPGSGVGAGFDPGEGFALKTVRTSNRGIGVQIETQGVRELKTVFKALGREDARFLRASLATIGTTLLAPAVRSAAASAAASFASSVVNEGVKGKGINLRVVVAVTHPGAKPMEFGRTWYYRAYSGRQQKSGIKFQVGDGGGQRARPYLGIMAGTGVAPAIADRALGLIEKAVEDEFESLCVAYGVSDRGALSALAGVA